MKEHFQQSLKVFYFLPYFSIETENSSRQILFIDKTEKEWRGERQNKEVASPSM